MKPETANFPPQPHDWLKNIRISFVPGESPEAIVLEFANELLKTLTERGSEVRKTPEAQTEVLLTSATFNEDVSWRKSLMFTGRARYKLDKTATVFCIIHVNEQRLQETLARLETAIGKSPPDPADFAFRGLAPEAYHILYEQGKRGGAILALERLLQAQAKTIHILLLVGEDKPERVYHFDLVGAYAVSINDDAGAFYRDVALRILTYVSTSEVTSHIMGAHDVGAHTNNQEPIPLQIWRSLDTPVEMQHASRELGKRNFFTEPVQISRLVAVPAISESVASQYSEGCFATWDPRLEALVTTITGSTRPVLKSEITEDDLAVISGLRADRMGVLLRHVEGKRNDPPSSEAVEMVLMDEALPRIELRGITGNWTVPVIRSKLHGHRGVSAYNPAQVEFVPLEPAFYDYPVTCATEAQAYGIQSAFARSEALRNPGDERVMVFTVLPTHGMIVVEKWVEGAAPFETIWKAFDSGDLVISNRVPQGRLWFEPQGRRMVLVYVGYNDLHRH